MSTMSNPQFFSENWVKWKIWLYFKIRYGFSLGILLGKALWIKLLFFDMDKGAIKNDLDDHLISLISASESLVEPKEIDEFH